MEKLSEKEVDQIRPVINFLLSRNYLLKEFEREKYFWATKNKEAIKNYFSLIGWDLVVDERHGLIAVFSPIHEHRLRLKKDETIWMLILRLIYEEKRRSLSISEYPVTSLYEIKSKYETFKLEFVTKSRLRELIQLSKYYQLLEPNDNDFESDDCRFRLFHSFIYVFQLQELAKLKEKIQVFAEGGVQDEMDGEN